jgi:hypothetical protein
VFPSNLRIGGEAWQYSPPIHGFEGNCLPNRHDASSQTRYQEVKELARAQKRVLAGTPGTLKQRTRRGTDYWVREYIRVDGRKDDEHAGTNAAMDDRRLAALREEIELARALAAGSSRLRLLGYQRIDRKPAAVLAALFNRRLFEAGLVLAGSHAYAALLNDCGLIAPAYRTQDIDLARAQPLELALPEGTGLAELINESGLRFVPVPGMPSRRPSTSYKVPGRETLAVDLLVPGVIAGEAIAVGELRTHGQAIPFLDFLVGEALDSVVLSPNQVVPVRLPCAERFALHKLYSSQRRGSQRDKARKDLEQAAILVSVLEEETPGLLADAWRRMPAGARSTVKRGARAALKMVADHAEAHAFLQSLSK